MSFLGLKVPHETARLLSRLEVPGKKEDISTFHVTMFYFGKETPIEDLIKAIGVTYEIARKAKPFTVRTSRLTCFPGNDDGVPIICPVDSDELHELRAELKDAYEEGEVPFNNRYPDYRPHVTLAYADEEIEEQRFQTIEWGAHELVLWGGDHNDDRLVVSFPLALGTKQSRTKEDLYRLVVQHSLRKHL